MCQQRWIWVAVIIAQGVCHEHAAAHDVTRIAFLRAVAQAAAEADKQAEDPADLPDAETCQLTINTIDGWSKKAVASLVRVTNLTSGKAVKLSGEFHRELNWFALDKGTTVRVPRSRIRVEAVQGLKTELAYRVVELAGKEAASVDLALREFYDPRSRGLYAGNTHLHLMNLTHAEADRYLRVVPRADRLDLVFLSLLRRIPDERNYISNMIVENSFAGGDLERLSGEDLLFANGQEHRHNFGRFSEGYGHVMLLNLQKLIRPVSIGPGIMADGTDGRPLQKGILEARRDRATVIWCHNNLGYEDLPNWVMGLIHAQNIFDGGVRGSYADTYYRYLNLGMRVPFSTGTDWLIYDFARVYVPVSGQLTAEGWLEGLRDGKSFITNGPFLGMQTERAELGGTLDVSGPTSITVVGRGMGRLDFGGLELVHNGKVVHRVRAKQEGGFHIAEMRHGLAVAEPGWFALRIPLEGGKSELNRPLFAHTSPIYVNYRGSEIFDRETAIEMVEEMRASAKTIEENGKFANDQELTSVLNIYRQGIQQLQRRIDQVR
jgi:hypothetical protein